MAQNPLYKKEYDIATQAAKQAGAIIEHHYHLEYEIEHKSKDQPVTIADKESNEAIKKLLLDHFPKDGWLSEETVDTNERLHKNRVWIVDPLDGTKEFINKTPEFAVSIALSVNGKIVVGVIYNPITHELFSAYKGSGAFLNDQPIKVSSQSNLDKAIILSSRSETKRGEWGKYKGQFIIQESGGMAHKMAMVACSRADGSFSLSPKTEWDFAAGDLIIKEAGGIVSQLDGAPFIYNKQHPRAKGIVYGNPVIYEQFYSRFKADFLSIR